MRRFFAALISIGLLAATPVGAIASGAITTSSAVESPSPPAEIGSPPPPGEGATVSMQEVATGALVVGGAFAIGLLAGGTLSSAIVSAGAVMIIYALIP